MRGDWNAWWAEWKQPAVLLAGLTLSVGFLGWHLDSIGDRISAVEQREGTTASNITAADTKIDRQAEAIRARVAEVTERIDRVLEGQTSAAERMAQLQSDVTYVKSRVDQIAEKLEVASAPVREGSFLIGRDDALKALEAGDLKPLGVTPQQFNASVRMTDDDTPEAYIMTPVDRSQLEAIEQPGLEFHDMEGDDGR